MVETDTDEVLRGRIDDASRTAAENALTIEMTIAAPPSHSQSDSTHIAATPLTTPLHVSGLPRITLGPTGAEHDLFPIATLGEGGMGRVLLAEQSSLLRQVAVKTLKEDAGMTAASALVREGRLTGALEHPAIVPIHALGIDQNGQPVLVMKRVEGVAWRTLLDDASHPTWASHASADGDRLDANLGILTTVCRALELAHSRGIIHRDIKPDNVMLGTFGEVYLVDWGIATTTEASAAETAIVGTPTSMAPEMAFGAPVDETTDVYLLGATLHRVLTGASRHPGETIEEVLAAAALSAPVVYPASVPLPLASLCNRACAPARTDRPRDVRAFRDEILAFQRHRGAIALCAAASERLSRLHALLADGGTPKDLASAYRLASEARFGFLQAREQYPEQDEARIGLRRCVEALVDLELRQDHVDTAEALLAEVDDAQPALRERLAAAREKVSARAREGERLRALDRQLDPEIGRRERLGPPIAVMVISFAIGAAGWFSERTPTAADIVAIVALTLSVTVVAILVMRRKIAANVVSRQLWSLLVVAQAAVLVHRVVALRRGAPIATTVSDDLVVLGACVAVFAAAAGQPRFVACAAVLFAGMAVIEHRPDLAAKTFIATMLLMLVAGLWATWTSRRASTS